MFFKFPPKPSFFLILYHRKLLYISFRVPWCCGPPGFHKDRSQEPGPARHVQLHTSTRGMIPPGISFLSTCYAKELHQFCPLISKTKN